MSGAVARWLDGVDVFLLNPFACSGVDLLRICAIALAALALLRLAIAAARGARIVRGAVRVRDARLVRAFADAARLSGARSLPPFFVAAPGEPAAYTLGLVRQAVFVSPELALLPDGELRAVLVHELSHVRRHDNLRAWWWNMVAIGAALLLAAGAMLYGGFVARLFRFDTSEALWTLAALAAWTAAGHRFLARELSLGAEISCDDVAARALGSPHVVADALLSVMRMQSGAAAPKDFCSAMSGRRNARRRIVTLLDPRARMLRCWMTVSVQLAIAALLLFVLRVSALRL